MGSWGPATVVTVGLTLIAALVGGAVLVFGDQVGPDALTFSSYLDAMSKFAVGVGLVGIGRGVALNRGGSQSADAELGH